MIIIGAGMSGMLAAQYFRSLKPIIVESQTSLPNNHKALLRFRSNSVSNLTGIPFTKVLVHKMINYKGEHFDRSNMFFDNLYSRKVTGDYVSRSTIDLKSCDRYIAPENFIELLSNGLDIHYGEDAKNYINNTFNVDPVISTMPVKDLANLLNVEIKTELKTKSIHVITAIIDNPKCNLYQTVYYVNPDIEIYRVSITGNKIIVESIEEPNIDVKMILKLFLKRDFGIYDVEIKDIQKYTQKYGKLIPCDTTEVKEFIHYASTQYGIFSLGRWGTHRQLLMDDVVNDIKVIDKLIRSKGYSR